MAKTVPQLARSLGAKLEDDGCNIRIEAPAFHVWAIDQVHELVCHDAFDARERMEQGLERCTDPDCDWCRDTRRDMLTVIPGGK